MRTIIKAAIFTQILLSSCSNDQLPTPVHKQFLAKELLNSNWQKQAVGDEEWYYRMTVVDAAANTQALGLASGHFLHPELIKWEITKDMLIGLSPHASVLNADHEQEGAKDTYRGAPVLAFPIRAHFDVEQAKEGIIKTQNRPWQERAFIDVDFSKNLISAPLRADVEEAVSINSKISYMIDGNQLFDHRRMRIGDNFIDVTARYPMQVSFESQNGAYGLSFRDESAAPVIDIRHFFMKKQKSDFIPLPSPDFVVEKDKFGNPILDKNGKPNKIAINRRFGLFRINSNGRLIHDSHTGTAENTLINATIFNIWKKSQENGEVIPVEKREVKQIVYYMNALHPEDLVSSSYEVAKSWDTALREVVFHLQQKKSLDDVPKMFVLRRNSCNVEEIENWFENSKLKEVVQDSATTDLETVKEDLAQALLIKKVAFTKGQSLELNAKRELLKLCTALEYHTEGLENPFIYQRPGDLRFNMLNLEMGINTTGWSGYGPMLSDPITGETITATANINMKYIDLSAEKLSKQIGLLNEQNPGLLAVFGHGAESVAQELGSKALSRAYENLEQIKDEPFQVEEVENFFSQDQGTTKEARAFKEIDKLLAHRDVTDEKSMMDPLAYVDNISVGIAVKYASLPAHERFLKIRDLVYQSVALHEIGHNAGLRHNMAGASDALNYGKKYWQLEMLPKDIKIALEKVSNQKLKASLLQCLEEHKRYEKSFLQGGKVSFTTQDCLQQKNGMYSSIMDYHASSMADIEGLGSYDKAAVKWAYGQLLEVFPKENLLIDPKKVELARWLKLNNYRHIPKVMLKDVHAIEDRRYVRFSWDKDKTHEELPKNAVPYAYCDDPSAKAGPRCLSYDFGPDMKSSALWLRDRFWQQYLLSHFAKDQSWTDETRPVLEDIDNLKRFTNILRWYYRNIKEDPEFKGSYAEQDYLAALGIGINHFAHVIGMPEPGAHVSAPIWKIDDQYSLPINADRVRAAKVMIPAKLLSACDAKSITSVDDGKTSGRFNFKVAEVPLGFGRPLSAGLADGLEEQFVLYSGSSLVKKYALYLLVSPLLSSHSPLVLEKQDLLSMTWYRMFPEAVSKIFGSLLTGNLEELGPIVRNDGAIVPRDLISNKDHHLINYKSLSTVMPAMESSIPLFAAKAAISFIPKTIAEEDDLVKSIGISCRGCPDEVDQVQTQKAIVRYKHIYGQEYSASVVRHGSSIGAGLLQKANRQKERYLKLKECILDEKTRNNEPFCQCIKTTERKTYADWVCCDEDNQSCNGPTLEKVGEGVCSLEDLQKRASQSLSQLEETVGFIDSLRALIKETAI